MGQHIKKGRTADENPRSTLGELIHATVRGVIEAAVEAELAATLGADRYARVEARHGYRNGTKVRTLTGPTGPVALTVPRATLRTPTGAKEWVSTLVPRYQRRLPEVNAAVLATYLAGGNTRRLRGALAPLLQGAPLSRSAISRVVATLKGSLDAWLTQPLAEREVVPDAKTLVRLAHLLDEPVLKDLLAQLVTRGRERRVIQGRRLRVDTTVVETNIHYPTDATLLADGVRVLTRTLRQLGEQVRKRTRAVGRRVFEIAQRSRTAGPRVSPKVREQSKARMKALYQGLMGIARAVLRQAEAALAGARDCKPASQLPATIDLLRRVVAQTRARVLRGDTRFPGKVVSLFEPHTEIIRKGKLAKPTEFGRRVKIQEAEAQFITDYAVCERGQADRALWAPALDRHIALFDHAPQLAVADGGFASRTNERAARDRGVRHVVLPRQPREQRSRAARAALRWRTGSEGRISALKRCHGLRRCRYRGASGMQRWVGLGVIANDLLALARAGP